MLSFLANGGHYGLLSLDLLLLYGCITIDRIRSRRVHPAFLVGAIPLMLVDTPLFFRLLESPHAIIFGRWLISFMG